MNRAMKRSMMIREHFVFGMLITWFMLSLQAQAEPIPSGGTLFTVYRDTLIRQAPSPVADVIESLPEAGTKVTWIEADATHPRWQKIRVPSFQKTLEGYVPEADLSLQDPAKAIPVWVQTKSGGQAAAGLVIATAATRAFMDFDPSVHQYAKATNSMESVGWLAKLSALEQAIDSSQINHHNDMVGIFPFPELVKPNFGRLRAAPFSPLLGGSINQNESHRPMEMETELQKCIDFGDFPVEETEARQISDLAAVALIERYGGLLVDHPQGVDNLNQYLYTVAQNLAARSSRATPYRLLILNSPQVNAFSTPGGDIFVTRGLLDFLQKHGNESQLALILGHEINHIRNRDGLARWKESKVALCTQILEPNPPASLQELRPAMKAALSDSCQGSLNLTNAAPKLVQTFTNHFVRQISCRSYEQNAELAADEEGLRLLILAGYRPDYQNLFSQLEETKGFGNHPSNQMRRAHLDSFFQTIRPRAGFFGYHDWPFESYPLVPFAMDQFQALETYERDSKVTNLDNITQTYLACDRI